METMQPIPASYAEWHYCITQKCGLELTRSFISERLQALHNPQDAGTRAFLRLYGEQQLALTIAWFEQALQETVASQLLPSADFD